MFGLIGVSAVILWTPIPAIVVGNPITLNIPDTLLKRLSRVNDGSLMQYQSPSNLTVLVPGNLSSELGRPHPRFNWPPWILVPSYEPGGAPIHIEIEDAKPLTDKDQIFDMKDDWHRLRSIPCQRGLAMQKRITSRHTKITTTMTCPNMKTPSDQDDQEFVIELAAEALEYGQLVYGPAALAGRIVDHADGVVYSEFATETVPVPSPPSPGWLPGEVDWKTEVLSPGRPKLELQVYSHGADHDIWDTFFLRTAINWYIGSMRSRGIEKAVFTKPSFDIQLVPPPRAGIKFPLSDQVALLNALKDFQRQHQARIVDFHMLSDGVVVAIGSLDPNNPKYWGPAD